MQFREHRAGQEESIKTLIAVADRDALIKHLRAVCKFPFFEVAALRIEPYSETPDKHAGWRRTLIVTIEGWGVVGFADSPS